MHKVEIRREIVERVLARRGRLHLFDSLDPKRTALLVVDMQVGLLDGAPKRDLPGVIGALETSLHEDFGASRWVALITDSSLRGIAGLANQHLRVVPRGSAELRIFETFFENARPRSGQMRDTQREYLFGGDGTPVGSGALIPLGERASLGLLAIGSHDTERFLPTMSTDFLMRIGELVSEAMLARSAA